MGIAANCVHQRLRQTLSVLATIAAIAPFSGFFCTVLGILDFLGGSAMSRAALLAKTANSIAEALVRTAMGILLATPTVWFFDWLS